MVSERASAVISNVCLVRAEHRLFPQVGEFWAAGRSARSTLGVFDVRSAGQTEAGNLLRLGSHWPWRNNPVYDERLRRIVDRADVADAAQDPVVYQPARRSPDQYESAVSSIRSLDDAGSSAASASVRNASRCR